jgi:hypothetical protein
LDTALLLAVAAQPGPNFNSILTVGATILIAVFAVGSGLGGYAAIKTGRTNQIAAAAVARADEATKLAELWKERQEATEVELADHRAAALKAREQDAEALHVAEHEIAKLKDQVATLTGVVTARHEIMELTKIVTGMATAQATAIAKLTGDHAKQHADHAAILAAIGAHHGTDPAGTAN